MKKISLLIVAKTALKYFFDIDPSVTEHLFELLLHQGSLISSALVSTVRINVGQSSSRMVRLLQVPHDPAYPAAA